MKASTNKDTGLIQSKMRYLKVDIAWSLQSGEQPQLCGMLSPFPMMPNNKILKTTMGLWFGENE